MQVPRKGWNYFQVCCSGCIAVYPNIGVQFFIFSGCVAREKGEVFHLLRVRKGGSFSSAQGASLGESETLKVKSLLLNVT